MIAKSLAEVTEADLQNLVASGVGERKTLEYKQELPGGSDADKKEFLADVSSFANTAGGDLLFGITEAAGVPTGVPGVVLADPDAEILRLESILRDGLSPRIRHATRALLLANARVVVMLRVERSWYGPHRVVFKNSNRFWGRTTNGKYELDVTDLRNAFLYTSTVTDRMASFRSERVIAITNAEPLIPLAAGPLVVVHVMPAESFGKESMLDVLWLRDMPAYFRPLGHRRLAGFRALINFEGICCVANGTPPTGYNQVYRNGVIEAVGSGFLSNDAGGREHLIPTTLLEQTLIEFLGPSLVLVQNLGCAPPVVVGITLVGVRNATLVTDRWGGAGSPINKDVLLLPAIRIDDPLVRPDTLLKPTIDLIWNACGLDGSPNFDDDGIWRGRIGG